MENLGKKISGFPRATGTKTAQQAMAEWQRKYIFDKATNSWYEKPKELSVSLEHTLPPETLETVETKERTLPTGQVDNLTLMRLALRDVSKSAQARGIKTGLTETLGAFKGMGIDTTRASGNLTSRIIDFVEGRVREPITEQLQTMNEMMDSIQKSRKDQQAIARNNLNTLITTGGLNYLDDKQLENLAGVSGLPLDQLQAIKTSQQANEDVTNAYVKGIEEGKLDFTNIPSDQRDEVIKKVDWTKIPKEEPSVGFTSQELKVLEARGIDPTTPEGRKQALEILYPPTIQEIEATMVKAQTQWKETILPTREAVKKAYEKELEEEYKRELKEKGFNVGEITKLLLPHMWIGAPEVLFGKKVPKLKFDEAEYQKRLKEVNADDVAIREWLKDSGITLEELLSRKITEGGFGIPGI